MNLILVEIKMSFIGSTVVSLHNFFQMASWALTLYLMESYLRTGSPKCWKNCLEIAQYEQAFDFVLALLKLTPNNPITVMQQVLSRIVILYFVMPMIWDDPSNDIYIFMVGLPWAITECIRYPFYQFKGLQSILGHLRYNLFIVLYPIGVAGELLCCYQLYLISKPLARS